MQLAADGIGFHADADQIIGAEHFQGLFASKAHTEFMIPEVVGKFRGFKVSGFQGLKVGAARGLGSAFW